MSQRRQKSAVPAQPSQRRSACAGSFLHRAHRRADRCSAALSHPRASGFLASVVRSARRNSGRKLACRSRPARREAGRALRGCGLLVRPGGCDDHGQPARQTVSLDETRRSACAVNSATVLQNRSPALSLRPHSPYIEAAGLPAMAINGRRNKPFGPGGGTRRLHHFRHQGLGSGIGTRTRLQTGVLIPDD